MTLPSKSIESSSLGNSFQSGDRRRDLHPDDLSPRDLYPDRGNGELAPGDDLRLQSAAEQPLPQQQQQQQQHPTADEVKTCKVCGDTATGMYFGALVCVPCKTFFLRYAGDGFAYECKNSKNCEVTTGTRTQCKFCRYQKCLRVGMCRRVRPAQVEAQDGQQLCIVCQDVANGVHFGVLTCEGCKKFFRRGLTEQKSYRCRGNQNCCINPSNRNACRYCRFQKCIRAGMSREAIQMGRPSKIPVFDRGQNHHQRSHGGERSRDLGSRGQQQHPVGLLRTPATTAALRRDGVTRGPVDYRGGRNSVDGGPGATTSRQPNGVLFPSSWPPDAGRETLSQRYDRILAAKKGIEGPGPGPGDWPPVGCYPPQPPPFVIVPKSGSDEGEKSDDGSTGRPDNADTKPASWRREDEFESSDPLSGLRATGSYWNHHPLNDDGDYFFTRKRRNSSLVSGFQDAVTLNPSVKQEVRSSDDDDDDDDDDYEAKRMRHDGCAQLPQDPHQLRLAGRLNALSAGQTLSRFHENPYSAEALEDYIPNPGGASGGHEGPPVPPESCCGSPGDVSSSPGRRVEGQIGSTRGQVAVGREFERRYDREFSGDRDYSDDGMGVPGDVGLIGLLGGGQLGPQAEEVGNQCWRTIKQVIPAYHRFVSAGTTINQQLKKAHEIWMRENPRSDSADELSSWIQTSVVPAYTTVSVAYCKCLPDFTNLCVVDQRALVAGGQSQSRILTAALHWYDVGEKRFRNFLSWRTEGPHRADVFKAKLLAFAERVTKLHLDPIEAALLNALGLFNSDYPKLQDRGAIEASREKISTTIKSYIAANHGAPGDRLECLWQVLKEAQVLGAEHVALTNTSTLGLPSTSEESRRTAEGASAAPVSNAQETDDDRGPPSALGGRATNHPPREEEEEEERPDDDVPPSDHVMTRSPGSRDKRPCVRTTTNGRTLAGSEPVLGRQGVLPNSVVFRSDDDEEAEEVEDLLLPDSPGSVDVG